jgi:hypothetical protein
MKLIIWACFCLLGFGLFSCSGFVAGKSEIGKFTVKISPANTLPLIGNEELYTIEISGITKDSALWIKSYSVRYETTRMKIRIEKSLRATGLSNPYYLQVLIPESVNEVFLGNELVWQKSM